MQLMWRVPGVLQFTSLLCALEGVRSRAAAVVPLAALTMLTIAGCSTPGRMPLESDTSIKRPDRTVVVFFVDGVNKSRMVELAGRGELPTLQKRFIDGGVGVAHAVGCVPAITYPVTASFLTGLFPGHHDILGNDWFDRHICRFQDYNLVPTYHDLDEDIIPRTLFEFLPDRFTVSSQALGRRGAQTRFDNPPFNGLAQVLGLFHRIDSRNVEFLAQLPAAARAAGAWPTLVFHYFPAVDQTGHAFGAHSDQYAAALRHVDREIGRIIASFDASPVGATTSYVLMSDHGHVQFGPGRRMDMIRWLREDRGLKVYRGRTTSDVDDRRKMLDGYDLVLVNSAFRRIMLHVNGPHGWISPAEPSRIQAVIDGPPGLLDLPAVGMLATSAGRGRVRIQNKRGSTIIEAITTVAAAARTDTIDDGSTETGGIKSLPPGTQGRQGGVGLSALPPGAIPITPRSTRQLFRIIDLTGDPLQFSETPGLREFAAAGWHDSREWLNATAASEYPDFVPQICALFESPRVGDIVAFAAEDWAFSDSEPGGHGSCIADDMIVPMYFSGPALPNGATVPNARIVDLLPTILDILGLADRLKSADPIDGVSILPQLRAAGGTAHP